MKSAINFYQCPYIIGLCGNKVYRAVPLLAYQYSAGPVSPSLVGLVQAQSWAYTTLTLGQSDPVSSCSNRPTILCGLYAVSQPLIAAQATQAAMPTASLALSHSNSSNPILEPWVFTARLCMCCSNAGRVSGRYRSPKPKVTVVTQSLFFSNLGDFVRLFKSWIAHSSYLSALDGKTTVSNSFCVGKRPRQGGLL